MSDRKSGVLSGAMEKIRHANSEQHAAFWNRQGLDYRKGNLDQNKLRNAGVWNACPVLDETGKPIDETPGIQR